MESIPDSITVSELNRTVRLLVKKEPGLRNLWVRGEFSEVKPPARGNLYPTLKDGDSEIRCTIWADRLDRLTVQPETGMQAFVHGSVDVFEKRGTYQFMIDDIRRVGVGDLYARLEALKRKLREEGLFARKRALPAFPRTVGLVTSATGAAVKDMIRIIARRFPPVRIVLAPVLVQGSDAAEDIAAGIASLNLLQDPRPDVIIVGRGGGSLEDLGAFNEERVARAIFASGIPVISAVGHERDHTVSDMVADLRAATPSEAAEKVVPDRGDLLKILGHTQDLMTGELEDLIRDRQRDLDEEASTLKDLIDRVLENSIRRLDSVDDLLSSLDPRGVLARGYAVVTRGGSNVESVEGLSAGDMVELTVMDGTADAEIRRVARKMEN